MRHWGMINHGFRQAVRVALWIAGGCLVVFLAFAVLKLMQTAPSSATAQRLNIAQAISGGLSAVAAITAAALAGRDLRSRRIPLSERLIPKLPSEDRLINRSAEMRDLVARIDTCRVVGCHGPHGAGKSFLLEHLADVVNGHRPAAPGQPKPRRVSAALYFDLAASAGFAEVQAQICQEVLDDADGTWSDFVTWVNRSFKHRRVILILDNVNSPGLWRQLGEAAYHYFASRPKDKLIFGSIEPVMLSNLDVEHVSVLGLDLSATKEFVATRGVVMSCDELVALHDDCRGLPLYVRLLTAYGDEARSVHGTAVIDDQLIPELPPEARQLLSYASLIALIDRRISLSELKRCPVAYLEDQLTITENRTLITPIPDGGDTRFKIHDVVRDSALRVLDPEVSEAALLLFERACHRGKLEHAALYAMFADPDEIGTTRFDELLKQVILTAIKARNYALLGNLYTRAREHTRILRFMSADQVRADLFCFARASELAGLGQYAQAEEELLSSSIARTRWQRDTDGTDLQADLRFLQADIAHLRNRYDEAAQMFEELGEWAAAAGRSGLQAHCVWGHGHVLRHQGRDLERALMLFEQAARLGNMASELFPKAYSITGATGIKVLTGVVPDDEEQILTEIEQEIATASTHDGYMLEVWKSQGQVAWLRGQRQAAIEIIEAAIERALALNDRLLYNLYFERAEYARFCGEHAAALEDYRRVLDFGSGNHDRNLIANAELGLVLLELSAGRWLYHGTTENARASVLRARQTAIEADIQITAGIADAVAAMLDDSVPAPWSIRLILL